MLGIAEDLARARKVHEIELGVKNEENVDRVIRNSGSLIRSHLSGN